MQGFGVLRAAGALVALVAVAACGGGGGGGSAGALVLSADTLSFVTNDPAVTPVGQVLGATVTTSGRGTLYLRVESTGPAVGGIMNITVTGPDAGEATVVPASSAALGPGTYASTITVTACTSGPACTSGIIGRDSVAVSYTITGVASALAGLDYSIGLTPVAGDSTRTLPISAYPSYSVTDDADWLTVTPVSGGAGGTLQLEATLDQALVAGLDSGTYSGTVTLSAAGGNSVQVPVTLTVAKPQLDQVTPYVAETGTGGSVVLRGLFLDQLGSGAIDLSTTPAGAGVAPVSVTPVSATEIRITHPALAAGTWLVRMRDGLGAVIDRSRARLVVVDRPAFAARTLAYPPVARLRRVDGLMYDAERRALLVVMGYGSRPLDENELMRFSFGADWEAPVVQSYPYLDALALSADGQDLVAASSPVVLGSNYAALALLSPTSLTQRRVLRSLTSQSYYPMLGVLSTNDILAPESSRTSSGAGAPLFRFSIRASSLLAPANTGGTMTGLPPDSFGGLTKGKVVVSADGMRAVAASDAGSSSDQRIWEYSASSSTNEMARAPVSYDVAQLRMDRTGDTLLVRGLDVTRIYDPDWNVRGTLPATAYDTVLAPDGSRAYSFESDGLVHIYDLTLPPVLGVFPEAGTLTPVSSPGVAVPSLTRLAITPDGGTLFMAGGDQVVVQPLP